MLKKLRIKKIEKIGEREVWDLTVPKYENFIIENGVISHNSPKEVRGITPGQEGIICLNMLPGEADRESACERPRKDGRLNSTHVNYLGMMPVHEMAVLEQGKTIRKINYVQPPRTMGWKPATGKFMNVWKNKYNTFKNIVSIKEDIEKRCYNSKILSKNDDLPNEEELDLVEEKEEINEEFEEDFDDIPM